MASPGPDEKRVRILDAAFQVCERRGVDGARMEEVAGQAGVSKGTLYRYFESKEHLLLATVLDSYQRSLPLLPAVEALEHGDPREMLAAQVDALVKVLEVVSPRMNVHYQAWSLVAKSPELKLHLYAFLRRFHAERAAELAVVIRAGQRRGLFRAGPEATALAEGLQALLSGFLYRATFDPVAVGAPLLRQCCDALLRDLLLPAAPDGGSPHG